jgi:hypothetical protein
MDAITNHGPAKREQRLKESVEGNERVLLAILAFETLTIEPNVPIRKLVHKVQQTWDDSVQPVCRHFFPYQLDEGLTARKHPSIHDIIWKGGVGVVLEVCSGSFLEQSSMPQEEAERVEPR